MEEKICFRAVSRYDEAAYNALAYLMIRKLRKWPRILLIAVGMITAAGSAVLMLVQGNITPLGILLMMLGSMMSFFGVLAQPMVVKMLMAGQKKNGIPENTYLFAEEKLIICAAQAQKEYPYSAIGRVLEMSGYLFFFMNDGQMYLMGLKDVKGSLKDFRAGLERFISQARAVKG